MLVLIKHYFWHLSVIEISSVLDQETINSLLSHLWENLAGVGLILVSVVDVSGCTKDGHPSRSVAVELITDWLAGLWNPSVAY